MFEQVEEVGERCWPERGVRGRMVMSMMCGTEHVYLGRGRVVLIKLEVDIWTIYILIAGTYDGC